MYFNTHTNPQTSQVSIDTPCPLQQAGASQHQRSVDAIETELRLLSLVRSIRRECLPHPRQPRVCPPCAEPGALGEAGLDSSLCMGAPDTRSVDSQDDISVLQVACLEAWTIPLTILSLRGCCPPAHPNPSPQVNTTS